MSSILIDLITHQIKTLYNDDFQKFIEHLYVIKYDSNFTPVKQKRDKGSDGFLNSKKTVLAIYAPEKRDLRSFKKKVRDDYEKYADNWVTQYPNWQVVYNLTFTANEVSFIESLKSNAEKIGPEHIVEIIEKFKWVDKRRIVDYLQIDDQFVHNDILITILDDLLRDSHVPQNIPTYKKPTYIEEKIELNYTADQVEMAKDEYSDAVMFFGTFQRLLAGYEDNERAILQSKIRRDYQKYSGNFSERFENLVEQYTVNHGNDDDYIFFVRVVLLYFFERCLIGKKTAVELI